MNKKQIIKVLETIALYLELKGENPFKISAYRKAAQALETDQRSIDQIEDPAKMKGIGKGTGAVIVELKATGRSELLETLQEEVPAGLMKLRKLPGLGGKKIAKLYQTLGVTDLDSLKGACEANQVQGLEGFGARTEEKILAAIENLNKRPERLSLAYVYPLAEAVETALSSIEEVERYQQAGSFRRAKQFLKDLDFVVSTEEPEKVTEKLAGMLDFAEITNRGTGKFSAVLNDDYKVAIDIRYVRDAVFASALHHFTGSKEHNVRMRQMAKKEKGRLSEYGIEWEDGSETLSFQDEAALFSHFGLPYIPPEVREGHQEFLKENAEGLGRLVKNNDVRADLHMHTTWSDGANTIEEMALAAMEKGYEYIVITDHSQSLRVAHGLTPERLKAQRKEIDEVNAKYREFKIFAGVEMDILPDGTLDYEDDVLDELDFVIGAIHSSFSQSEEKIMARLETALAHPKVRLIAHPTGRILGGRAGYPVDIEALIKRAAETGTALELNANPNRLDLAPEWVEKAKDAGVKIAVNTDAHSVEMLDYMDVGVASARRGWLASDQLLNSMDLKTFETFLLDKQ